MLWRYVEEINQQSFQVDVLNRAEIQFVEYPTKTAHTMIGTMTCNGMGNRRSIESSLSPYNSATRQRTKAVTSNLKKYTPLRTFEARGQSLCFPLTFGTKSIPSPTAPAER